MPSTVNLISQPSGRGLSFSSLNKADASNQLLQKINGSYAQSFYCKWNLDIKLEGKMWTNNQDTLTRAYMIYVHIKTTKGYDVCAVSTFIRILNDCPEAEFLNIEGFLDIIKSQDIWPVYHQIDINMQHIKIIKELESILLVISEGLHNYFMQYWNLYLNLMGQKNDIA